VPGPSINRPLLAAGSFLDVDAATLANVAVSTAGCSGVGLRITAEHSDVVDDIGRARELASRLAEHDQVVHDVEVIRLGDVFDGSTMHRPSTGVVAARPDWPDLPRIFETAQALGARYVLAVSDLPDMTSSVDGLTRLRHLALDHGVDVAIEYMAWTTPATLGDALRVHESTGCRIVVDALHHTRTGGSLEELVGLDSAVAWFQICDAPRRFPGGGMADLLNEARHGRMIPGTGGLPVSDVLAVLPSDVVVSIEVQSDELLGVEPEERSRRLVDSVRQFA
jgi:sugar phosphate isomerase/epimerase